MTIQENQKRIREYIQVLQSSKKESYLKFFIVLHNFLFIEEKFSEEIFSNGKQMNVFLNLPETDDPELIEKLGVEYYDPNTSWVRFGLETLDSIESVRIYLSEIKSKGIDLYSETLKSVE